MGLATAKGLMAAFVWYRSSGFCAMCVLLSAVGMVMGEAEAGR